MNEIKIEVVSRIEAGEILCTDRCAEITYLVSIGDGEDPLPEGYENAQRKVRWMITGLSALLCDECVKARIRKVLGRSPRSS